MRRRGFAGSGCLLGVNGVVPPILILTLILTLHFINPFFPKIEVVAMPGAFSHTVSSVTSLLTASATTPLASRARRGRHELRRRSHKNRQSVYRLVFPPRTRMATT